MLEETNHQTTYFFFNLMLEKKRTKLTFFHKETNHRTIIFFHKLDLEETNHRNLLFHKLDLEETNYYFFMQRY